jgi:hypothetical protein
MKTNSTDLNIDQIDSPLTELVSEVQAVFRSLDCASAKIRELEDNLQGIKAHFPFDYRVQKSKTPGVFTEEADARHRPNAEPFTYVGYSVHEEWYLSWEINENSKEKAFRLFLICKEKEFTVADVEGDPSESITPMIDRVISKKALIETDLPTRLRFIPYLDGFVLSFTEHLRKYRESIEGFNPSPLSRLSP